MTIGAEERGFRALLALVRDGVPLIEGCRAVAGESGLEGYRAVEKALADGASLLDALPGLPAPLRPLLRWGERTGDLLAAMEQAAVAWSSTPDARLPLLYLGCAVGSATPADLAVEGRECFDVDPDWTRFAAELADGAGVAAAAAGKPRILPPPAEAILARAESSGVLPEILLGLWEDARRGPARAPWPRAFFAWSLLMTAGSPLEEALATLRSAFPLPDLRALRTADFVASLEGAFTPTIRALLKKACECGNLARTLRRIADDLDRGWLPA